ncbi:MAG: haloacid dehalogenase-like hydrolase family protein [Chthonomonadaceae bacterium]|nr:haloacid dehalogenase-like hydrolase family protein [Chthonomonadaceae bacterium]
MTIEALAFDVNGTLIDILTDESMEEIYRSLRHFLTYQGIDISRSDLRDLYFRLMKEQQRAGSEPYPEYDAVDIWRTILAEQESPFTNSLPTPQRDTMPLFLAQMYRAISRKRLQLYPYVQETLEKLRTRFPLAIVTDAQSAFALGELHHVGLTDYFHPIIVSGDYGYRKPDPRLFQKALEGMGITAAETLYVGNDMYRDIYGAKQAGMQTLLFNSPQGDKTYPDTSPDFTITDYRELLPILGLT